MPEPIPNHDAQKTSEPSEKLCACGEPVKRGKVFEDAKHRKKAVKKSKETVNGKA